MEHCRIYILLSALFIFLTAGSLSWRACAQGNGKKFVLVIDAGHGGHDPGAIGKISKEKNINLNVALKLGKLIQENCSDVKIIYTRRTDVFIPLDRRAEIANNAKADLFISIHTNSVGGSNTAKGASTWTLGLAKSDANLAVAKRENSVILYESDYKTRYAGFNPNSAESYIIFEFMQDKYMQQSVRLASMIQKQFKNSCNRIDRGVHQAGFLVLKASAMPSVLVELGFISTPEEERYLNSESGSSSLARGIFRAFMNYKRDHEIRMTGSSNTVIPRQIAEEKEEEDTAEAETPTTRGDRREAAEPTTSASAEPAAPRERATASSSDEIVFKIQILTSDAKLKAGDRRFKGLKNVDFYKEKGIYKYTYGASTNYNKVLQTRREIASKFKDAFIIAFKGGEKMDVNKAIAEFKKRKK
jgi:N-acetylmuramoyl-L-alanine amidase